MKVVEVTWDDAQGQSGWTSAKEIVHQPDRITSVGWVVRRDKRGVTICQNRNQSGRIGDTLFVPTAYIRSVKRLSARGKRP